MLIKISIIKMKVKFYEKFEVKKIKKVVGKSDYLVLVKFRPNFAFPKSSKNCQDRKI